MLCTQLLLSKSFRLFCIVLLQLLTHFQQQKNAWSEVVTDYVIGFEKGATDVHYRIIASKPNIGRIASLENTNSAKLLCEFCLGSFLHFLYMPIKL